MRTDVRIPTIDFFKNVYYARFSNLFNLFTSCRTPPILHIYHRECCIWYRNVDFHGNTSPISDLLRVPMAI